MANNVQPSAKDIPVSGNADILQRGFMLSYEDRSAITQFYWFFMSIQLKIIKCQIKFNFTFVN